MQYQPIVRQLDKDAARGNLHVLKSAYYNNSFSCTHKAFDGAAASGQLETLMWLKQQNITGTIKAINMAAANGHHTVVMWLHYNAPVDLNCKAVILATENGHHVTVKWLLSNGYKCTAKPIIID